MIRTRTLYFGVGWFNEKQTEAYNAAMAVLKEDPTINLEHSYVPLRNQYEGIRVDEHPEYLHGKEWTSATYTNDLIGTKTSDVMLDVHLPEEEDISLDMELGYAMGRGEYVLLITPNKDLGKPINLMGWGVYDNAIKISELRDFDFNKPRFGFCESAVY